MRPQAPILDLPSEPTIGETIALLAFLEHQREANTIHEYTNHFLNGVFCAPLTQLEAQVSKNGSLYDLERLDLAMQHADRLFRFDRMQRHSLIVEMLKECANVLADAAASRQNRFKAARLAFALEALIRGLF